MARLEIPSIVVHAGSCSCPASPQMERATRSLQRSLSKQDQVDTEETDDVQGWKKSASVDTPCSYEQEKEVQSEPVRSQQSGDPPTDPPIAASPLTRPKSQNRKVKLLVRSHAMREETSPPPDPERATLEPPISTATPGARPSSRLRLKHQGSSQGSVDSSSPLSLSRDSSTEQPPTGDSSGVDLPTFLTETVNRSHKDRTLLLRIEQDLLNLARDPKRPQFKFPPMSSYQRMLVHRMSALYNMEHNVDPSGTQVLVARTQATRIPELRLRDQVRGELEPEPRRSILKRDTNSLDDTGFKTNADSRRSKSFEEREEEYEKVRKRIFKNEGDGLRVVRGDSGLSEGEEVRSSQEELRGTWAAGGGQTWSSSDSSDGRPQLLRPSPPHSSTLRPSRLLKVESFESREHLRANSLRQAVSKSYSFGGYSGGTAAPSLARGDSMVSTHSAGARLLTKQDSGASSVASRLSPLSSGYKSLGSQRSDATLSATPSPTATPMLPQGPVPAASSCQHQSAPTLVWAVTCMDSVPPGSVLINPQTGQPYLNSDGSVYRFDPSNPPRLVPAPDPPPVHSAPQPPSIQVHPSYTCAPAPPAPPPVDYHQPPHMVYTYAASTHQQHTHQTCHPQEVVSELAATFLSGLQLGAAEGGSCGPPSGQNYVVAPAWAQQQAPQSSGPRPALLPPPSSPQQPPPAVVVPGSQSAVLLVPPARPMALFSHSGGSEGYFSPPQQMLPPPGSSNNPGSLYPTQHTLSPSTPLIRAAAPAGENVAYSNPPGPTYFPGTPTGMCPASIAPYCYSPGQVVGSVVTATGVQAAGSVWCRGCQQNNSNNQQQSPQQILQVHLNPPSLHQGSIPGPSTSLLCSSYNPPPWQHPWHPGKLAATALQPWGGVLHNQPCSRAGQSISTGRSLLLAGTVPTHCDTSKVNTPTPTGHVGSSDSPMLPFAIHSNPYPPHST